MTAREYLQQVRRNLTRREAMEEDIARLRSLAYPPCAFNVKDVRVQENAPGDRLLEIMAAADAKIRRYQKELARIRRQRVQAQYWIEQIKKPLYRQLLEQYYLTTITAKERTGNIERTWKTTQTLEMVAGTLGRSHQYIREAHRSALEAFAEVSGLPMDEDA